MTKRNLPAYVYTKKGVLYFQRRGYPTTRIASAPGSPEFHAEYAGLRRSACHRPAGARHGG
jgi:hypothetical protein